MKTFQCDRCGSLVFFENVKCVTCGHALDFLPGVVGLNALEPASDDAWRSLPAAARGRVYRLCENGRQHQICNWLVAAKDENPFCSACRLNHTIPDLTAAGNRERRFKIEKAKRRLIHTVLPLHLPLNGRPEENRPALSFNFIGDAAGGPPMLTGYENGLITLNIAEADDVEREWRRVNFREPYRTLPGHFRHERAHYYWDRFIAHKPRLTRYRELFGDETRDYSAALKTCYEQGPPADLQSRMISVYASSHPWEVWAETWAHYLHMIDTIETAASFGVSLHPKHPAAQMMTADPKNATEAEAGFARLLENWLPLTYALNSLNRGMGLLDLYPFVLSTPVIEKLRFIHETVQEVQ